MSRDRSADPSRVRRRRQALAAAAVALLALAAAVAWRPVAGLWHLRHGRELLADRAAAAALSHLNEAGKLRPGDAEVDFLTARAMRRLENYDRFAFHLGRAERLGLSRDVARRERILAAAQAGRLGEAEPHLARLLQTAGDDGPEVSEAYVRGYFANLRLEEALRLLDAWAADYPEDAEPYFMRGYAYEAMSDHVRSVEQYREGLRREPGRAEMRRRLAAALAERGENGSAAAEYRRCLAENPRDGAAAVGLARTLFRQGDPAAAEQVLLPVLARTSGGPSGRVEALSLAGEIALTQGRYGEAARRLEPAAESEPYDTKVRYSLAKALRALGRAEEARAHFDYVAEAEEPLNRMERQLARAIEEPRNVELRYEIAVTMMRYSDPDAAARWLRSVLELDPHHTGARRAIEEYLEGRRKQQQPENRRSGGPPAEAAAAEDGRQGERPG